MCQENGWTPEFYEDAEGHKSATTEKNRPRWLALKSWLADPDIAAQGKQIDFSTPLGRLMVQVGALFDE